MKTLAILAATTGIGTAIYAGMPPERFRGDTAAVVLFMSPAKVNEECGPKPPYTILACHRRIGRTSYIILPNPCPYGEFDDYAKLACHEIGHVNSWGRLHEP